MADYFTQNPRPSSSSSSQLPDEPQLSPLDSPLETPVATRPSTLLITPPGSRTPSRSRILSPSQLVTVLPNERARPPKAQSRFLHGGPPLSDLSAASAVLASATSSATPVSSTASAWWRAFTDEEEERLERAWDALEVGSRMGDEGRSYSPDKAGEENEVSDPDSELQAHIVPVGLDSLFSVDLRKSVLFPDFWSGASVRVIRSMWFYAPPTPYGSRPSHLVKAYPVDVALAASLERAYTESIRPWEESYAAELASALKVGPEAEAKLRVPVVVRGAVAGFEVIFQGKDWGRLYSTGLIGSVGKSFMSGSKGHGGGQVVLRGWEAAREWKKDRKAGTSPILTTADSALDSDVDDTSPTGTPTPRSRTSSATSSVLKPAVSNSSLGSSFLSSLRSKMGGGTTVPTPVAQSKATGSQEESGEGNSTEEAMAGPRKKEGGNEEGVGEVDELVLVVHGIGQKLAGTYESFNFVHAVNSLRTACTTQSTSPSLAPLIHSRRAQFIPVRWRSSDLEFDDRENDTDEENLNNRFSLDDIEIKHSVPFLRQVVSGLVLDVPFYLSPHHKAKMIKAVVQDANRIYRLFCARNPGFAAHGRVSIIAHSLGSTLCTDILSTQPTFVKPLADMTPSEKGTETQFVFDTRVLILVGSPLAFFLHLGKGQLIARKGRARSKNAAPDIALDRPRYGCLAIDTLYNVYAQTDPVAFSLNATVDAQYSRLIRPIAIPSTNTTLLQNLSDTYARVSRMFDVSSLWASGEAKAAEVADAVEEKVHQQQRAEAGDETQDGVPKMKGPVARPGKGLKRMPSEKPMSEAEFVRIERAEKRFKALNPRGCIDFYLPSEGYNQYLEALSAHGSYWYDQRFATFTLLSLFSSEEELEKNGREELGSED